MSDLLKIVLLLIVQAYTFHYYVVDNGSAIHNYDRYSLTREVYEDIVSIGIIPLVMPVQLHILTENTSEAFTVMPRFFK